MGEVEKIRPAKALIPVGLNWKIGYLLWWLGFLFRLRPKINSFIDEKIGPSEPVIGAFECADHCSLSQHSLLSSYLHFKIVLNIIFLNILDPLS